MRTALKLAAFGGSLAVAFTAALGVGAAVGDPLDRAAQPEDHGAVHSGGSGAAAADAAGDQDLPRGLMVSDRGYTLALAEDRLPAGADTPVEFRIVGADGRPLTDYTPSHDEDLHLIGVRRDSTGFQHVHPEPGADGSWTAALDLSPGEWRVFADFVPANGAAAGETVTLGADLAVAGEYQPEPLPAPSTTAEVDGYEVTLDGRLVPGEESELTLSVSRDGQPVTDLQPYLAAYGHLVPLRDADMAYLHVHPVGEPDDGTTRPGPDITFLATTPSVGDYRMFLDFKHGDVVRTADFTVRADDTDGGSGATAPGVAPPEPDQPGDHGDGH